MKKILIIDDHSLFADGLSLILEGADLSFETKIINNATQALERVDKLVLFDLVLIDLHMPIMDGFAFLSAVKLQKISTRVAVISGTDRIDDVERAIALGANGFIPKDSPSKKVINAVKTLLDGSSYVPEKYLGRIDFLSKEPELLESGDIELTDRQSQVLRLMADGLINKQIALVLGVSVSAVKSHIENIFRILNVNNRTACVRAAETKGLID